MSKTLSQRVHTIEAELKGLQNELEGIRVLWTAANERPLELDVTKLHHFLNDSPLLMRKETYLQALTDSIELYEEKIAQKAMKLRHIEQVIGD